MKLLRLNIVIILSILCVSCLSVSYPDRQHYLLQVTTPAKTRAHKTQKVLAISDATIASQFANSNFVYRTTNINYLTDYYNLFLVPPAQQITLITSQYLANIGLFKYVSAPNGVLTPDYLLNSKILALYADYRNPARPKAVIDIQFAFFNYKNGVPQLLFDKTIRESIQLRAKDSESLVNGWNVGLQRILYRLTLYLNQKVK